MSAVAEVGWKTQDAEDKLSRVLFEHAPVWIAECTAWGSILHWNPALGRALSRAGSTKQVSLYDLIRSEDRQTVELSLQELFAGLRSSLQFDSRSPVNGITMRWTIWSRSCDGTPDLAMAMADEIRGHERSEPQRSHVQRLEFMGRLAGGVAHDFNNLLTGMLLYCDLALNALEPRHRARKYAEEVRKAAIQAAGIVRQLLSVTRPNDGATGTLSLNEVAENMRDLLTRMVGENIVLNLQLDQDLGQVRMDMPHAQQVLLNLVLNARDAMPNGGGITVETRNCQIQVLGGRSAPSGAMTELPCALLVVADQGVGIDEPTRAHLFEAFFTTKGSKGTGLGLATVQDIVRSNGGLIHVHSAPGCGTRVSVLLPLVAGDQILQDNRTLSNTEEVHSSTKRETTLI